MSVCLTHPPRSPLLSDLSPPSLFPGLALADSSDNGLGPISGVQLLQWNSYSCQGGTELTWGYGETHPCRRAHTHMNKYTHIPHTCTRTCAAHVCTCTTPTRPCMYAHDHAHVHTHTSHIESSGLYKRVGGGSYVCCPSPSPAQQTRLGHLLFREEPPGPEPMPIQCKARPRPPSSCPGPLPHPHTMVPRPSQSPLGPTLPWVLSSTPTPQCGRREPDSRSSRCLPSASPRPTLRASLLLGTETSAAKNRRGAGGILLVSSLSPKLGAGGEPKGGKRREPVDGSGSLWC